MTPRDDISMQATGMAGSCQKCGIPLIQGRCPKCMDLIAFQGKAITKEEGFRELVKFSDHSPDCILKRIIIIHGRAEDLMPCTCGLDFLLRDLVLK